MLKKFLPAILLLGLFASCDDDNDPVDITLRLNNAPIEYNADEVWEGVGTNNTLTIQTFRFSHEGEIGPWGLVWNGFTPARVSTTGPQTDWIAHQFQIPTAGGMSGKGTPYMVAFWDNQETEQTPVEDRSCRIDAALSSASATFKPISVYVVNTDYTLAIMSEGNAFAAKFEEGDYLTVTAHGVHADKTESQTTFNLAKGTDFVKTWTLWDLSSLGNVTEIYFTMDSSDKGQWGINTPTYFAIDCLTLRTVFAE